VIEFGQFNSPNTADSRSAQTTCGRGSRNMNVKATGLP